MGARFHLPDDIAHDLRGPPDVVHERTRGSCHPGVAAVLGSRAKVGGRAPNACEWRRDTVLLRLGERGEKIEVTRHTSTCDLSSAGEAGASPLTRPLFAACAPEESLLASSLLKLSGDFANSNLGPKDAEMEPVSTKGGGGYLLRDGLVTTSDMSSPSFAAQLWSRCPSMTLRMCN
jgi:hypothetical protein